MYKAVAYQLARTIAVNSVTKNLNAKVVSRERDELFVKIGDEQFAYVFQFGVVSFFNMTEREIQNFNNNIWEHFQGEKIEDDLYDSIDVEIIPEVQKVTFDTVVLPSFDEEMIRLVLLHTAQSVALDRYTFLAENLLEETTMHTRLLESRGKLGISGKRLKRFIGRTLLIKNRISENLYIFDAPEVAWDDERLTRLDNDLKRTFDLKSRYRSISDNVEIVKENLDLFIDIWHHKESSFLEWIIIILILVEVVDMFINKVF